MAELICPTCGKSNSEGSEQCWFCQRPLQSTAPAGAEPAGELPDWLAGLGGAPTGETPTQPAEGDVPEWLERIRQRDRLEKGDEPVEETPTGADLPDWMQSLQPEGEETAAQPVDNADWMAGLRGMDDLSGEGETPADEEPLPAEVPDWLAGLSAAASFAAVEPPAEEEPAVPAVAPAWLSEIGAGQKHPSEIEIPAEDEVIPAEIPDWMAGLGTSEELPVEGEALTEGETEPAEIPDWMAGLGTPAELPVEGEALTEGEVEPAEIPDWMAGLSAPQQALTEDEAEVESGALSEMPDWLAGLDTSAELPDWLATEKLDEEPEPAEPATSPAFIAMGETEAANWLPGKELAPEPIEEAPAVAAFTGAELPEMTSGEVPEWLSGISPASVEGEMGDASSAELPDWVEAMRPVEVPVQSVVDERVESSGPLAGLVGILPGEDLATTHQKPPIYSAKLQVSERHHLHAGLLDSVLSEARQPRAVRSERRRTSQTGTRLIVALVLFGAILLSMIVGALQVNPPSIFPAETAALVAQVDSLPADGIVLVAADYQAGLSGELRLSAQPVIERLMARGLRLALISTQPNGTALARQVISAAAARHAEYAVGEKIADLGYLAGDASGLGELAARPLSIVRPTTLDGKPLSESPALQGVEWIGDFAAVLVLTDSLENGQAWIEQVQPAMSGKALLMVASAQAGPLLRPYSESGQVQGLLTGLAGGAAFEQIIQQPGVSSSYFSAYHGGVVAAILLMLVGVVLQAIVALFSSKKA